MLTSNSHIDEEGLSCFFDNDIIIIIWSVFRYCCWISNEFYESSVIAVESRTSEPNKIKLNSSSTSSVMETYDVEASHQVGIFPLYKMCWLISCRTLLPLLTVSYLSEDQCISWLCHSYCNNYTMVTKKQPLRWSGIIFFLWQRY